MSLLTGYDREIVAQIPTDKAGLTKYHGKEYIDNLEQVSGGNFEDHFLHFGLGTSDCPAFKGVLDNAFWAAGATITAAKLIVEGQAKIAFNPSGGLHHAGADYASGFCYVNDAVLGIMQLTDAGQRVLYLDIDVHHGDGVQNAFCTRNDVISATVNPRYSAAMTECALRASSATSATTVFFPSSESATLKYSCRIRLTPKRGCTVLDTRRKVTDPRPLNGGRP